MLPTPFTPDLKPLLAIQPFNPFVIYPPALLPKPPAYHPIASPFVAMR